MNLAHIVPWGRSFQEYEAMFSLSRHDHRRTILGCGDGPAAFNAEFTRTGGRVISIDPLYAFGADAIRQRIDETATHRPTWSRYAIIFTSRVFTFNWNP